MTRLEELINSLASIIVRYHDSQNSVVKLVAERNPRMHKEKARRYADNLMSTEVKFDDKLRSIIDNCTKKYEEKQGAMFCFGLVTKISS